MIIHVVKPNENLKQIVESYRIDRNDLIANNLHITDFNKLMPGTKLRIPLLSQDVLENLEASEPFIEEYYPKAELGKKVENIKQEEKPLPVIEDVKEENSLKENLERPNYELDNASYYPNIYPPNNAPYPPHTQPYPPQKPNYPPYHYPPHHHPPHHHPPHHHPPHKPYYPSYPYYPYPPYYPYNPGVGSTKKN